MNAGATLDFNNSFNQAIRNLNGGGNVKMGNAAGDNLTLLVDGGTTKTFSGTISGAHGSVLVETTPGPPGIGTMVFTGANTYGGGTTICSCATLQLGDFGHTGSIVGDVTVYGKFNIVNADTSGITSITNDREFPGATPGKTTFSNATSAGTIAITNLHAGKTVFNDTSTAGSATIVNRLNGLTTFNNTATAGNASITNRGTGETDFINHSSAGSSVIVNRNGGLTSFANNSTAGSANITNRFGSETDFINNSTAGGATITNRFGGLTVFSNNSDAGTSAITNRFGGGLVFSNTSSAGSATIVNGSFGGPALPFAGVLFTNQSSAGNATITNNGLIAFGIPFSGDKATAGNANITNNNGSELDFNGRTTAGGATVTANDGAIVKFFDNSTGGTARFITNGTGYVDFGETVGPPGSNRHITAGSIEGSGLYYIGGHNTLVVGGNNFSTEVSGVIADNNPCGCTTGHGALEKVGDRHAGAERHQHLHRRNDDHGRHLAARQWRRQRFDRRRRDRQRDIRDQPVGQLHLRQCDFGLRRIPADRHRHDDLHRQQHLRRRDDDHVGHVAARQRQRERFDRGDVIDNATFAVKRSDSYTFGGVISGSGAFQQTGGGTTIFTGNNTYGGGTTITAGTLQLGNGSASGSIVGNLFDNATFAIKRSDSYTFGGMVSGSGVFQQTGTGTTIFTGNNTYTGGTTITAGTLQLGNGGTTGSIMGDVVDNATFAIKRSDSYSFDGIISGSGAFQQNGTGMTTLTGSNLYTGATTVNGGFLDVMGSIASSSSTTVNNGGALTGSGIVGNTHDRERRHFPARQRLRHLHERAGQSRLPVRRALSGAAQFDDLDLRRRHRHGAAQWQCRRGVRARQHRDEAVHDPACGERRQRHLRRAERRGAQQSRREPVLRSDPRLHQFRSEFRREEQSQRQPDQRRQRAHQFLQQQWRHSRRVRLAVARRPDARPPASSRRERSRRPSTP